MSGLSAQARTVALVRQGRPLLYGDGALKAWRDRASPEWVGDVLSTQLFYPPVPFRAARSGLLSTARLRTGHLVERVEERPGGVDVVSRAGGKTVSERFDRVAQAGRNFTDHPMGFVAKLKAAKPSDAFAGLRDNAGLYARSETMLKMRDGETGLWSAFYLRPGIGSGLASDPYVLSFELLTQTTRVRRYLAGLPNLRDPDFLWQALENQLHVTMPSSYAYVLVLNEQEATGQIGARRRERATVHRLADLRFRGRRHRPQSRAPRRLYRRRTPLAAGRAARPAMVRRALQRHVPHLA